jgi:hypothetical protein
MSGGSVMKYLAGMSMMAVIHMVLVVESWRRLVIDSPLWRESERV